MMDAKERIFQSLHDIRNAVNKTDKKDLSAAIDHAENVAMMEVLTIERVREIHQSDGFRSQSFAIYKAPCDGDQPYSH